MDNTIGDLRDELMVRCLVIALGSHADSEHAFSIAKAELIKLGDVCHSSVVIGRDFTGRTQAIYHNACVHLKLDEPCSMGVICHKLKAIERLCGRTDDRNAVSMDLDVLAVSDGHGWSISQKRLPFKAHERAGLSEVADFLLTH